MEGRSKVYFASDFHLGLPGVISPMERERRIVAWLESIVGSAREVYLLGDIFDFWYEYCRAIPKGFTRFLGAVARLCDAGVKVHFFTGNHDVWMFDYFSQELGVEVHRKGEVVELDGVRFFLCHGDGLGPGGYGYRLMKWAFHNRVLQRLFAMIHPSISIWLGTQWSRSSRKSKSHTHEFRGEKEPVVQFAQQERLSLGVDYFVMGHLHMPLLHRLEGGGALLLLGDWILDSTFGEWDGQVLSLHRFDWASGQAVRLDAVGGIVVESLG